MKKKTERRTQIKSGKMAMNKYLSILTSNVIELNAQSGDIVQLNR